MSKLRSISCAHCADSAARRERIRSVATAIAWCCALIAVVFAHSLVTQWLR